MNLQISSEEQQTSIAYKTDVSLNQINQAAHEPVMNTDETSQESETLNQLASHQQEIMWWLKV